MIKPLRVGIAGLGTVGTGLMRILTEKNAVFADRCGRPVTISAVSVRDATKTRGYALPARFEASPVALADADDVDLIVELMGGEGDPAYTLVKRALERGKPVVTANKALLSRHGMELAHLAEKKRVALNFEAAVAGGIPIIKAIREALVANRVHRLYGILNGTCNFILTEMTKSGRAFSDVLGEAQARGYAEADPTFDVGGLDAAHKLSLLAALAFGTEIDLPGIHVEGIEKISPEDIQFAGELGYRIKLLGIARATDHGIEQRVHPTMVPANSAIARIEGVTNAVMVEGSPVGNLAFEGPGAGSGATASAVAADIADIARGSFNLPFIVPVARLKARQASPIARHSGMSYVRLRVRDKAGVMAAITAVLAKYEVSIESLLQHGRAPGEAVSIVMTMHECPETTVRAALDEIGRLDSVLAPPNFIRIESFA
ncbi:MAG: homoserine dehydrogenase [Alphaproteobacteria bacterium]